MKHMRRCGAIQVVSGNLKQSQIAIWLLRFLHIKGSKSIAAKNIFPFLIKGPDLSKLTSFIFFVLSYCKRRFLAKMLFGKVLLQ